MSQTLPSSTLDSLSEKGITQEKLDHYHQVLVNGYPYITLSQNCVLGKEIHEVKAGEIPYYRDRYKQRGPVKVLKFVPASGAASRMFKDLFASLETGIINDASQKFFDQLQHYPFASSLMEILGMPKQMPLKDSVTKLDILKALLFEEGLNYGSLPKGLILFHQYADGQSRTAFEEHFHEAVMYALTGDDAYLHFTVPEATRTQVELHLKEVQTRLENEWDIHFHVSTSLQKPSTDTPAIYSDDHRWAPTEEGTLLLRPAGHGALLENLNELDADLVFVKNIDNVVPDHLKPTTVEYKEVIAGILLEVQAGIFEHLTALENGALDWKACAEFFQKWFQQNITELDDHDLKQILDRPLRVCGMVKNEGEPGGGPFLVDDGAGKHSLQIVEKAQIDPENANQMTLLKGASHFNPVDLVLTLKNHKGEKYDLLKFRNANTGMVVSKTHMGRDILALELPGLWNGSMHHWNTVFVEVPIETFNPVKTVFDLLRPVHQGV